jgi:ABC-type glutathione transport system ATPase component
LVVGIFGEWGAGKSYLLNLIYKLAQKHSEVLANKRSSDNVGARSDSGFEITIPVFFQPWKYEHEEHLHVPLLMHIIDAYAEVAVQAQTTSH